jgi:hypothetical protein
VCLTKGGLGVGRRTYGARVNRCLPYADRSTHVADSTATITVTKYNKSVIRSCVPHCNVSPTIFARHCEGFTGHQKSWLVGALSRAMANAICHRRP